MPGQEVQCLDEQVPEEEPPAVRTPQNGELERLVEQQPEADHKPVWQPRDLPPLWFQADTGAV